MAIKAMEDWLHKLPHEVQKHTRTTTLSLTGRRTRSLLSVSRSSIPTRIVGHVLYSPNQNLEYTPLRQRHWSQRQRYRLKRKFAYVCNKIDFWRNLRLKKRSWRNEPLLTWVTNVMSKDIFAGKNRYANIDQEKSDWGLSSNPVNSVFVYNDIFTIIMPFLLIELLIHLN